MESLTSSFFSDEIKLANNLHVRSQHNHNIYEEFLDFMNKYNEGETNMNKLCIHLVSILEGHPYLLYTFMGLSWILEFF